MTSAQPEVDSHTTDRAHNVTLTEEAATKARSLLERDGSPDMVLRIAVQPGGCSGLRYELFFDDRSLDGDATVEFSGVPLVVDKMSKPYLDGAVIGFADSIEKQGFTIDNPNAGEFLRLRRLVPLGVGAQTGRGAGRIAVTGSIATDHLMHFPGRFTDSLLPDQLHRVSLSFLVDDLQVRRGGVAANICFTMGVLGRRPILVDAVGTDFDDYDAWLTSHGVDTSHVLRCTDVATARFVCTTDDSMNQIGSFFAGAMARANEISLTPVIDAVGGVDLVMISAGDPTAMTQHAAECRANGYAFAADPSQQLARIDGDQARTLVAGAELLFSNDYELGLLKSKTGWSDGDIAAQVRCRITTHGAEGIEVAPADGPSFRVPAMPELRKADPTGVGDGFRGGFLAGRAAGLPIRRCTELGALMATLVLETVGTQEYRFDADEAAQRIADAYGAESADEIAGALGWRRAEQELKV